MSSSDNPDVVVEVRRNLLCPVQHCPHHGPGPLLPLLHCPIATPGSPRGNNQCSTDESIQAVHAVAGIQTHYPLIRGNLCLRTATSSWTTESLQLAYPCHDGDLNPRPSHQREFPSSANLILSNMFPIWDKNIIFRIQIIIVDIARNTILNDTFKLGRDGSSSCNASFWRASYSGSV